MKNFLIIIVIIAIGWFVFRQVSTKSDMSDKNSSSQMSEMQVSIAGFAFSPETITVKKGTKITWTNNDSMSHTVTAKDKSFDSGALKKGQTFSYTFSTVGSFDYMCTIHPGMTGKVVVTE